MASAAEGRRRGWPTTEQSILTDPFNWTEVYLEELPFGTARSPCMQQSMIVINTGTERHRGKKALEMNIAAASEIASVVKTSLGPRAMYKMMLDPMGGIVLTKDGNAILREIDVSHPAAKMVIELSRTQDAEVGDGTTSVVVLCGEILSTSKSLVDRKIHPVKIVHAFRKALGQCVDLLERTALDIDAQNNSELNRHIQTALGTKLAEKPRAMVAEMALKAVQSISKDGFDIKRLVKIEKIPGGTTEQSMFLDGIVLNKDVLHPGMRRSIVNPRILLLDTPLEYKKGESTTNIEIKQADEWQNYLEQEEQQVVSMCEQIVLCKPDIVISEKGISDVAQQIFVQNNITAIRRVKKSENIRVSRATGAQIVGDLGDVGEEQLGTGCGLFRVDKIGDEYFSYLVQCKNARACSVVLRGGTKDTLNELGRTVDDALGVARCLARNPRVSAGGGASEMAMAAMLCEQARKLGGIEQWCFEALARALEVIPRTLVQNSGGNAVDVLGRLRHKHRQGDGALWGVDGETGELRSMEQSTGIWEPTEVKLQTLRTAVEAASMLLRVDDILAGVAPREEQKSAEQQIEENEALLEE